MEHCHVRFLNEFQSADSHLATFLEENSVGNRIEQPRSHVVEGSRVPEVCLMQCLHGKSRRTIQTFRQFSGGRNSETTWPNFVIECDIQRTVHRDIFL